MNHIYSKDLLEDRIHLINAKNQQKKIKVLIQDFQLFNLKKLVFQ